MSNKLVLNFICKNEEKVIERMLTSAVSITDVIVALDTGSTDNTIALILDFGAKHGIDTVVYESPFKGYANSRNEARKLCDTYITFKGYDKSKMWTYFFDCDEELIIDPSFDKNAIDHDFYMMETQIASTKYTRNTFTNMTKAFHWVGAVHEYLEPVDLKAPLTHGGIMKGIMVNVHSDGHSWSSDIHTKYKNHAILLEEYIRTKENRNGRWVFYTGQSWWDAAQSEDKATNDECLRRAMVYFQERTEMRGGVDEERYISYLRIGQIMKRLEYSWGDTLQVFLKAYSLDPVRGESIREIVEYYGQMMEWNLAYIYSKAAVGCFFNNNPYKNRFVYVDSDYYQWKVHSMHATVCLQTNRKAEAKNSFNVVLEVYSKHPEYFTPEDVEKLKYNAQFFA